MPDRLGKDRIKKKPKPFIFLPFYPTPVHTLRSELASKMNVISTIVGTLCAVILGVAFTVFHKQTRQTLLVPMELYLYRQNSTYRLTIVRALHRYLTPPAEKKRQTELIRSRDANLRRFRATAQRELWLLENKSIMETRKAQAGGTLSKDDEALVKKDNRRLQEVRVAFDEIARKNLEIDAQWISGSWTLEVSERSREAEWERDQTFCKNGFGCCARDCGCCTRPRKSCDGQLQELFPDTKTHCTDNCGCCMRWRNAYQSEKED